MNEHWRSKSRIEYHVHKNEARWFGLVYERKTGKRLSRQIALPFADSALTAVEELKRKYEDNTNGIPDHLPRHD